MKLTISLSSLVYSGIKGVRTKFTFSAMPAKASEDALLWGAKANGARARSSEELKFLSSQATLSYRVAVATDANAKRRRCQGKNETLLLAGRLVLLQAYDEKIVGLQ